MWMMRAALCGIALAAYSNSFGTGFVFDSAPMLFAAGSFGIALAPVANLFMPIGTMIGERFLYLPSVAFAIALVALAYRGGRERFVDAVRGCGIRSGPAN